MSETRPPLSSDDLCPARRTVLRALIGVPIAGATLAACSSDDSPKQSESGSTSSQGGSADGGSSDSAGGDIKTSDVPVGTAKVVSVGGKPAVIAQPTDGEFVAYQAVCTHESATIGVETGELLRCPLHGSEFKVADGSATKGPATDALTKLNITKNGDTLTIG